MTRASFYYRDGLAVLRDAAEAPGWMVRDRRLGAYVAPGHRLPELRTWAGERGIRERGEGPDRLDVPLFDLREPRDYQRQALERWVAQERRGSVVLPTGAGKTLVALLAIDAGGTGACVVAPTRALVSQWFGQLADAFGADRVGAFYGEEKDPRQLTVTTYHSAFALLERWGDRFDVLVLDEVHHLADGSRQTDTAWHDALRIAPAAARLGLTATYPDGRDRRIAELVGPVAYRRRVGEMVDAELAGLAVERRFVTLTAAERERYEQATATFETFMDERAYRDRYPDGDDGWKVFMAETRRSPPARRAFAAFRERERIVAEAEGKLRETERILRAYPAETAVLFCGSRDAAAAVSRRFAIPMIEASTPASERKGLLDRMADGRIRAVAAVRVLDEGWDVPGAKLGLVLGDTTRGSPRQHAQRLGRILRRQGDRVATLYELVAADTHEFFTAQRRSPAARTAGQRQLGLGL